MGPAGTNTSGQMAKVQRTDQQTGHDLVAHAQNQCGVEHVVAQRHRCGHGDHVAAEQAQLHAGGALRDAVAHGGNSAGHLRSRAVQARLPLDQVR